MIFRWVCSFFLVMNLFAKEVIYSDKAVFKLKNKVYFSSDLKFLLRKYEIYSCLVPDSYFLSLVNIKEKNKVFKSEKKLNSQALLELIKLEKFVSYVGAQDLKLKKRVPRGRLSKCGVQNLTNYQVERLFKVDQFIYERFSKNKKILKTSVVGLFDTVAKQIGHEVFL